MKVKFITSIIPLLFCFIPMWAQKPVRDSLKAFTISIVQKAMEKGKVKKLAVWDFTDMNKEVSVFGSYISEQFSVYAENIDSLELMDRQNLKSLLNEHKLKSEGFIDKNTIMGLGRFKEVDAVVVGSVIMADKNFQVVVKIIETSFGRTVAADEQFFQIDKNMAAILGIEFNQNANSNTSNRGFNQPLNSNEQYNNAATVNKDCETKNTGDYCFYNNSNKAIYVYVIETIFYWYTSDKTSGYSTKKVHPIILRSKESKCLNNCFTENTFRFYAYSEIQESNFTWGVNRNNIIDEGDLLIEKCKSKTYNIK